MAASPFRRCERRWLKKNPWFKHLDNARIRCRYPSHKMYPTYGGRGIRCDLSFAEIKQLWNRDKADELQRPSLDRIDSDGNYTVANCRFIELIDNIGRRLPDNEHAERKEFA